MKARIRPVAPCALVWNYDQSQPGWQALQATCQKAGLALKPVSNTEAGHNVGWLCGIPGASEAATLLHLDPDSYPAALILNGLDRKQLDGFLKELNAGGVRIPLKAVVTATNQQWPLCELLAELCKERDAMAQYKAQHTPRQ